MIKLRQMMQPATNFFGIAIPTARKDEFQVALDIHDRSGAQIRGAQQFDLGQGQIDVLKGLIHHLHHFRDESQQLAQFSPRHMAIRCGRLGHQ